MKLVDSIFGFIVGDALGVPVEFVDRKTLKNKPVTDMEEFGTHHQPKGTWSDDTSMTIATMDSIIKCKCIDYNDIMNNFCKWVKNSDYTATDKCFDIGKTCNNSISKFNGNNALECGENYIYSNGNGSLMRILPIVFYCYYNNSIIDEYEVIKNISSLTHAHEISILGCYLYMKYIHFIIYGYDKNKSYEKLKSLDLSNFSIESKKAYDRILKNDINKYKEREIKSSGYIVDTLEAVLWVVLNTKSYKDSVLTAINLGDDTDTIAAITGGITGIIYGLDDIPYNWLHNLKKYDYLINLCNEFESFLINKKNEDLDNNILERTIDDLKSNPNACTTIGGLITEDGKVVISESNPGEQLSKFIEYIFRKELIDKNYVESFEKIRDKKIEDYTYEDTITALTKIIRGDRFVSGQIYSCFKDGTLLQLLEKLKSFTDKSSTLENSGFTKFNLTYYLKLYKERFKKDFVYNVQFDNSDVNIIKIINECLEHNIDVEQYYDKNIKY